MSDMIVAPKTRDLDVLARQLTIWLGSQMPKAKDIKVDNLAYPKGAGRSHETILFDVSWTEAGATVTQGCVARVKPSANMVYPDDLFEQQYHLTCLLHEQQWVPMPEPLWLEQDPTVIGAPVYVMKKVLGRVPVSYPPYAQVGWVADATPAQRRKFWENGVRQLAAIQKVPLSELDFLAGPEGVRSGLEQEWSKYVRFVEWISEDRRWPVLDAALEQLRQRWPKNQPEGLVWGDARLGNMMFNDDFEVVAVMDWEQPSLGGALHDLTWWLYMSDIMHSTGLGRPHLEGMGTREETIDLWQEVTGISIDDIEWYDDFTAVKVNCLAVSTAKVWGNPPPEHSHLARRLNLPIEA